MVKIHEFHDPDNALSIDRENTLEAGTLSMPCRKAEHSLLALNRIGKDGKEIKTTNGKNPKQPVSPLPWPPDQTDDRLGDMAGFGGIHVDGIKNRREPGGKIE